MTEAERTVARLMGTGCSNKQIAAELGVSTNTVGTHARSIFAKLDVRSRAQLSNKYHDRIAGA
ncbi:response regulator transcription factor [Nonomuraea sp. NPDC050536]|uniref:response regulator transcription factor n=1 Tax=Nonomuraea sp. NPDC050536 TaxID=3364366 RepID=UPI0037C75A12